MKETLGNTAKLPPEKVVLLIPPSTLPVRSSVKEPGKVLRTLLSNPWHLTLRREKKNRKALLSDK